MELKLIIESLLFASSKPLTVAEIKKIFSGVVDKSEDLQVKIYKKISQREIEEALENLRLDIEELGRPWSLSCIGGAWQFVTRPEYAIWVRFIMGEKPRSPRLTQATIETLAIIAYRQPITRAEIEEIRGVSVDGVIGTLLERKLIQQLGKADLPGKPTLYGTTLEFLQYFGLSSLDALPDADQLRRRRSGALQINLDNENQKSEKTEIMEKEVSPEGLAEDLEHKEVDE